MPPKPTEQTGKTELFAAGTLLLGIGIGFFAWRITSTVEPIGLPSSPVITTALPSSTEGPISTTPSPDDSAKTKARTKKRRHDPGDPGPWPDEDPFEASPSDEAQRGNDGPEDGGSTDDNPEPVPSNSAAPEESPTNPPANHPENRPEEPAP